MISFIVDGFDPWERVRALLEALAQEMPQGSEIILVASNLLDTPLELCQSYGKGLFGDSFRLIHNDEMSILAARIRAQAEAHGETFVYLSPLAEPAEGFLEKLLGALDARPDAGFAAPVLTCGYPGASGERILCHGYAVAPGRQVMPFMLAFPLEKTLRDLQVQFVHPYCLISRSPFYSWADRREHFFASHLAACEGRNAHGLSVGAVACRLDWDDFPPYYRVSRNAKSSACIDVWDLAAATGQHVQMTPYNSFVLASPVSQDRSPGLEEHFWGLLTSQNLSLAASAAIHRAPGPVKIVAQHTLYLGATTTFMQACERAREWLPENHALCQSYEEWFAKFAPLADVLYAPSNPRILDCFKGSKRLLVSAGNFLHILCCGLFGLGRRAK